MDDPRLTFTSTGEDGMVDVHVYIVPPELWRNHQQSAVNQIINDTVSAGFIRAVPEWTVCYLRQELESQLGDELMPRDYVFLKSVGRCLARLRTKQEYQLKVKNFLPPQAYAPEIFILEATPELRATFPPSGTSSERSDSRDNYNSPYNHYKPIPPIGSGSQRYGGDTSQPGAGPKHTSSHKNSFGYHSTEQHPYPIASYPSNTIPYANQTTQTGPNTPVGYSPGNPSTNPNLNGVNLSPRTLSNKSNISTQTAENSPNNNATLVANQQANSHNHLQNEYDSELTPAHDRIVAQGEDLIQTNAAKHQISPEENNAHASAPLGNMTPLSASPSHSSLPVAHRVQSPPGGSTHYQPEEGYLPPLSATPPHTPDRQHQIGAQQNGYGHRVNGVDSGLDDLERRRLDEMYSQEQSEPPKRQESPKPDNGESSTRRQREEEERRRREWEEEEKRRKEAEQRSREEDQRAREKREKDEASRQKRDESEERLRREAEEQRRREEEATRRRQQARTRSPEDRKQEKERLQRELEIAKEERRDIERKREELVKKAKALQAKTQQRRNQARDNWKKKYFEEKKKTSPMEEQSNRLKQELDGLHKRIMAALEGPKDSSGPKRSYEGKPSQQSNYKMQATKLQHEIEDLQRRADNIKMKLTSEMKLRNQAETELRALRAELTQKKISVSLTRSHQQTPHPVTQSKEYMFNSPRSPMITQR